MAIIIPARPNIPFTRRTMSSFSSWVSEIAILSILVFSYYVIIIKEPALKLDYEGLTNNLLDLMKKVGTK